MLLKDLKIERFPLFSKDFISSDDQIVNADWSRSHSETDGFDFADLARQTTVQLSHGKFRYVHQRLVHGRELKDFV